MKRRFIFSLLVMALVLILSTQVAYAEGDPVLVTGISISSPDNTQVMKIGETLQLSSDVLPIEATDPSVTWSSNNDSVATVSSSGLVTAVSDGDVTITATANDGSGITGTIDLAISYFSGEGSADDPYSIASTQDLKQLAVLTNAGNSKYNSASYLLQSDIDLASVQNWISIGSLSTTPFQGIFDGNEHRITNLKQDSLASNTACGGLFGYVTGGIVKNLNLEGIQILAEAVSSSGVDNSYAGGIAGYLSGGGSIINCHIEGYVTSQTCSLNASSRCYAGGIVGYISGAGKLESCSAANESHIMGQCAGAGTRCYVGGILGYGDTIVSFAKCNNAGHIGFLSSTADNFSGGIVGCFNNGSIEDCYNTGEIDAYAQSDGCAGGIASQVFSGAIRRCYNLGRIDSSDYAGGISGYLNGSTIEICSNQGMVNASGNYIGGVAGVIFESSIIRNCYNTGEIRNGSMSGGIVGGVSHSSVSLCYNIGSAFKQDNWLYVGGIAGSSSDCQLTNCYYLDRYIRGSGFQSDTATKVSADQLLQSDSFSGFDFDNVWTMQGNPDYPYPELVGMDFAGAIFENTTDFAGGSGLPTNPYQIKTKSQLNNVQQYKNACFILENDIDFSPADFAQGGSFYNNGNGFGPIDQFNGVFDGNGKSISGLYTSGTDHSGLFNSVYCGAIKNLTLLNSTIRLSWDGNNSYGGSIAGYAWGSIIRNCVSTGTVSVVSTYQEDSYYSNYCGGILGYAYGCVIDSCFNTASVSAKMAGGIVGYADKDGFISNCYNTGNIYSPDGNAGGMAGGLKDNTSVDSCYNIGAVTTTAATIGGIAGSADSCILNNCYYLDNVSRGLGAGIGNTVKAASADLQVQSTFSGFDFSNVWTMSGNASYPYPELKAISQVNVVTFDSGEGSAVSQRAAKDNSTITAPADPAWIGHRFAGWFRDADRTIPWVFNTDVVTAPLTLYAGWTAAEYTVTFDAQGGTVSPQEKKVSYQSAYGELPTPELEGYTFQGWYTQANGAGSLVVPSTVVTITDNQTVFAKWTIKSFTVSFNSMGGSKVQSKTVNFNATVSAPANPTRAGYIFVAWYKESSCGNQWIFNTDKVKDNITLFAGWISAPTAPSAASYSYNSISVRWNTVAFSDGYELWRSTSSTGGYTLVTTVSTNAVVNSGLTTGKTYYFKVRAYKRTSSGKVFSGYTMPVSTKPIPRAPASVSSSMVTYNSIKTVWTAVAGASGYQLYRSASRTGTYTLLATVSATTYTNSKVNTGTTYYYKVRAYRRIGSTTVYGSYSALASAKTQLSKPTQVKATPTSYNSIKVSWGVVAGATKYEVYRAKASNGPYALIATTPYSYYANTNVNTGSTYYYKVRAYRLVGRTKVYGGYSSVSSAKTTLSAPASVRASRLSPTSMKISWGAVAGATKYEVWQSETSDTTSGDTFVLLSATGSTSYTYTSLTPGMYYKYRVRAYRLVGAVKIYSGFSIIVKGP